MDEQLFRFLSVIWLNCLHLKHLQLILTKKENQQSNDDNIEVQMTISQTCRKKVGVKYAAPSEKKKNKVHVKASCQRSMRKR
jgi:hypothetical protein